MLLRTESLWSVVSSPPHVEEWDDEDDADKITQFSKDNEKGLCLIRLSLEDHQLVHIRGLESAKECWNSFKTIYAQDSVSAQIHLTPKLFRVSLHTEGDIMSHLEYMKGTLYELQEKEIMFSELQQVYIVLSSLNESYSLCRTWRCCHVPS